MADFKTAAKKRAQLFKEISEASEAGHSIDYIYFDEKDDLKARFTIVDKKLRIIFEQDDVVGFNNINIEEISKSLVSERERNDFKSSYEKVKRHLSSDSLENGISANLASIAYWGPMSNRDRRSQRYNAYEHFFFKTSDLRELGSHFEKLLKEISRNYVKINDLADLFADNSQDILPAQDENQKDDDIDTKDNSLPNESDCEKAVEALFESGRDGFDKEEVIAWLASYFNNNNILLSHDWRTVTQRNIDIWFQWKMESSENVGYTYEEGRFYSRPLSMSVFDYFNGKGLAFSKEILSRYFLSLKTKPFVILTGISGTGKTKIAQIFAEYMCQDVEKEQAERRKAFIPVHPDWMDNKGLLGFYNILDQKYHPTPLLDLLLNAKDKPEKPHFVILDEMNLAKVEQYFSDFLSIMESRTADRWKGEQIPLHSGKKVETENERAIPGKIHIPSNVFFTGTVNVDETTYMFSPKVLDRANVIEFNEVDLDGDSTHLSHKDEFFLENPDVRKALVEPGTTPFCSKEDYNKFKDIIGEEANPFHELLTRLKQYNLHFGYRVVNEMSRFIWMSQKACGDHFELSDAIDIQILQKVLPKFRGTQGRLKQPLADLLYFCYGESPRGETPAQEMIQKALDFDKEAAYPRSAQKIARMINNLNIQGYTSFIE